MLEEIKNKLFTLGAQKKMWGDYWIIDNNYYSIKKYETYERALEASKSNINCIDCFDCEHSQSCIDCKNSNYCVRCVRASDCDGCKECVYCVGLENCEQLINCWESKNCQKSIHLIRCVGAYNKKDECDIDYDEIRRIYLAKREEKEKKEREERRRKEEKEQEEFYRAKIRGRETEVRHVKIEGQNARALFIKGTGEFIKWM